MQILSGIAEHPRWSPDGTQLAFTSTRSGYFDIWLVDVDMEVIKRELELLQRRTVVRLCTVSPTITPLLFYPDYWGWIKKQLSDISFFWPPASWLSVALNILYAQPPKLGYLLVLLIPKLPPGSCTFHGFSRLVLTIRFQNSQVF